MSVTFMDRQAVPSPTVNPSTPRLVQINGRPQKNPVMTAGGDFNPMTFARAPAFPPHAATNPFQTGDLKRTVSPQREQRRRSRFAVTFTSA